MSAPRGRHSRNQCHILCFAGLVALAGGSNPIPFRTRPLNPSAPMVHRLKTRESRSLPGLPRTSSFPASQRQDKSPVRISGGAFCFVPVSRLPRRCAMLLRAAASAAGGEPGRGSALGDARRLCRLPRHVRRDGRGRMQRGFSRGCSRVRRSLGDPASHEASPGETWLESAGALAKAERGRPERFHGLRVPWAGEQRRSPCLHPAHAGP
jgi:hypothetical protein